MTTRRRRGLSSEDVELWTFVTRDVEPLKRRRRKPKPAAKAAAEAAQPSGQAPTTPAAEPAGTATPSSAPPSTKVPSIKPRTASKASPKAPRAAPRQPPKPPKLPKPPPIPPIAPIDRKERRQVVRGTRAIEARIDLHGMRQAEAHGALRGFLAIAQIRGYSLVLVITGKGAGDEYLLSHPEERGVLRRLVPQWLRMPDMRSLVLGFEEAHQGHGGAGALYVRLRRLKKAGAP